MSNQNKKIDEIVKLLLHDDNIIGISLVGSFIKYNDYNDLDFLVVSTKKNVTINLIKDNFRLYDVGFNDDSIRVKNYMNKEIGFGLYDKKNMDDRLCNYLNGKNLDPIYKNWNIVGWLPECLLYDILNMQILFEKDMYMTNLKQLVSIYSPKMKSSIIRICDEKLDNLCSRKNKANKIEKKIIESEILSLKIRKAFAKNEMYFRGYKNIDNTLKEMGVKYE